MNSFIDKFEKYNIPEISNGVKLPSFEIEQKHKERLSLDKNCSEYDFLLALCLEGLEKKVGRNNSNYKNYYDRAKKELKVFKELGFCSYLLITWDIVDYCRLNNIATGFARGSAAGSLVLYLIDCTQIDSLKYNLYFERFLSKTRAKFIEINGTKYYQGDLLMDIDLDISFSDRYKLTSWLENKYKGKIAKLLTISTYSTKILLKEIVKCYLELDETKANEISELIPKIYGQVKSINESIELSKDFKEFVDKNKGAIEIANKLYLLNSHFGVHASAWVISADPITELFPLQLTREKEIVTGYAMEDALNLATKVDILGLRCSSLLETVCNLVNIKANKIDLEDNIIYDNLQNLKTPHGLFQIESETNLRVVKKLKPKNLNHLAAVVACARPGGLEFVDQFAKFIETGEFQSIHPFFDDILKDSAGVPIYQESQLRMLNKIGFSLEESEIARRILGKKKLEEVKEWNDKIREKAKQNNLSEEIGDIVAKVIEDSASYSFNFCLSPDTIVETKNGNKMMFEVRKGEYIKAYDIKNNKDFFVKVLDKYENRIELYEIELDDGRKIKSSLNHKYLCEDKKMRTLEEIIFKNYRIMCND